MSPLVRMRALKAFTYGGQRVQPGQELFVRRAHVSLFRAIRRAALSHPEPLPIEPQAPEDPPKRRRYRRRDMQPEE